MNPMSETGVSELPALLRELYGLVDQMEALFPGRRFTPDGHMVGSIGEAVASYCYGLALLPASNKAHDATAPDGRLVQVKLTGGTKSVPISHPCEFLIVLRLAGRRHFEEVYNGPGDRVWAALANPIVGKQNFVPLGRLRAMMAALPVGSGIPRLRPFPDAIPEH